MPSLRNAMNFVRGLNPFRSRFVTLRLIDEDTKRPPHPAVQKLLGVRPDGKVRWDTKRAVKANYNIERQQTRALWERYKSNLTPGREGNLPTLNDWRHAEARFANAYLAIVSEELYPETPEGKSPFELSFDNVRDLINSDTVPASVLDLEQGIVDRIIKRAVDTEIVCGHIADELKCIGGAEVDGAVLLLHLTRATRFKYASELPPMVSLGVTVRHVEGLKVLDLTEDTELIQDIAKQIKSEQEDVIITGVKGLVTSTKTVPRSTADQVIQTMRDDGFEKIVQSDVAKLQ